MKLNNRLLFLLALLAVLGGAFLVYSWHSARKAAELDALETAVTVADDAPVAEALNAAGVQLFLDNGEAWKAGVPYRSQGRLITKAVFTSPQSITEAQVTACGKIPSLSQISCFDLPLTKDHLGVLSRLPYGSLDLNYTNVTDEELRSLESCHALTGLMLNGTRVTDEGLSRIAGWPSLLTLTLYDTAISDQGLDRLAAVKTLRTLDVQRTRVTLAGVTRLRQTLPNCIVHCDPY